jgi:hypothetical protein
MWLWLVAAAVVLCVAAALSLAPFVSADQARCCPGERRVLRQIVALLGSSLGANVDNVLASLEIHLAALPRIARAGFRLGLWLLEQGARASFVSFARFSALPLPVARVAHGRMAHHRLAVFGQLIEAVHLVVFLSLAKAPEIEAGLRVERAAHIAAKRAAREMAT